MPASGEAIGTGAASIGVEMVRRDNPTMEGVHAVEYERFVEGLGWRVSRPRSRDASLGLCTVGEYRRTGGKRFEEVRT